jgi:hypothetical protein
VIFSALWLFVIERYLGRFGLSQFFDELADILWQLFARDRVERGACMFAKAPDGTGLVVAQISYVGERGGFCAVPH